MNRGVPAIVPATNVSAWLALTESDRGNGCVKVIPGTHRKWYDTSEVEGSGMFNRGLWLDGFDDAEADYIELEAGQFFLFNESLVHGSDPNPSDRDRTGVVYRYTPTSTRVLEGRRIDESGMPLARWHAILVHGRDEHGHNRLGPPPDRDLHPLGPVRRVIGRFRRRYYKHVHGGTS